MYGQAQQQLQAVAFGFGVDITVEDGFVAYDEDIFVKQAILSELLPGEVAVAAQALFVGFVGYGHR